MSDTEKDEALVQLAGSVAHELNNIFTAVAGNLSLLEASLDEDSQKASLVSDVIRTANRGIELSQKLQAFAGRQKLNRTHFDVNQSVANVIAELKRSLLRSIDVELVLLPASCIVAADEEKFQHVLEELIRNAAVAMNHRGWIIITTNQLTLQDGQIGRLPAGNYIRLSVRDSGGGMSPEVKRRALDPLFSTRNGHQGWGLAKCAGFVRQSGGEIMLSSVQGQGTAAEVYFPRKIM
ncbi:MAG TPA: ATP-binding protein [Rhizomicrobium sp.]|nr:ATP-binding protein [Rhizomicrobium sp.]